MGASSPEQYGDHYAWGETSTKATYTQDNSKTYCKSGYNHDIGGDASLDAARARWGGMWRLPTADEAQELVDKCKWEWTTQGGQKGYKVTGPSGQSIFLPAASFHLGSSLYRAGECGYYWASTPDEGNAYSAQRLDFHSLYGHGHVGWFDRYSGRSVRPVSE